MLAILQTWLFTHLSHAPPPAASFIRSPHAVHIPREPQSPDCAYPKVLTGFVYIRSDS